MKTIRALNFLIMLAFGLAGNIVSAQKYLQLERSGSLKVERFAREDKLRFKLHDDPVGWYERVIEDLNPTAQMVQLGTGWHEVQGISAVWLYRKRVWPNIVGIALQAGGASMILGDLYNTIRGDAYRTEGGWEFGLANLAVGTGLRLALSPIRRKMGDKNRLRVIDLTF